MNHKDLVECARTWLLSAKGCNPVFTEKGSSKSGEIPDAIGWTGQESIIVECKASECDLRADVKKIFRPNSHMGMGDLRYYLFSCDLWDSIKDRSDIDFFDFGIVCVSLNGKVEQVRLKHSARFAKDKQAEIYYLRNRILEIQKYGR